MDESIIAMRECSSGKAMVETWRWPKWHRQISKGYRFLSAKVTQAIMWHIDLYPLRKTLPQKKAQNAHTHRPRLLPTPNYYCFMWMSCGWLRSSWRFRSLLGSTNLNQSLSLPVSCGPFISSICMFNCKDNLSRFFLSWNHIVDDQLWFYETYP